MLDDGDAEVDDWKFSQSFGEEVALEDVQDSDIISAVEFDQSGAFLAAGDRNGRIVVFELDGENRYDSIASAARKRSRTLHKPIEYRFQYEFQSHEPKFDYLKSLDIEERINRIRWCNPSNNSLFLLSTNDKTIKLWKIYEKEIMVVSNYESENTNGFNGKQHQSLDSSKFTWRELGDGNEAIKNRKPSFNNLLTDFNHTISSLEFFKSRRGRKTIARSSKRVFANAHTYHINSLSINSDGETFLSADDLRVNLWNIDIDNAAYNIVDMKPDNMEELSEVITGAEFHPSHCNVFIYSSSRGCIRMNDMRERALCDNPSKIFEVPEILTKKALYSEIICSLSDIKFTKDGRYIVGRDYLSLKLWDVRMEREPVHITPIQENLQDRLDKLYENEFIFDKFELAVSGDGNYMATGGYNNGLHVIDWFGNVSLSIECGKMPYAQRLLHQEASQYVNPDASSPPMPTSLPGEVGHEKHRDDYDFEFSYPDAFSSYNRKILHLSWHPTEDLIACAGLNNLYIYSK